VFAILLGLVAFGTLGFGMDTGQREFGFIMIESDRRPGPDGMATGACIVAHIFIERAIVRIRVALPALVRLERKNKLRLGRQFTFVTGQTGDSQMGAFERVVRFGVSGNREGRRTEAVGRVALLAGTFRFTLRKCSIMEIRMTITAGGELERFICSCRVAFVASNSCVLTDQRVTRFIVIKVSLLDDLPSGCIVAGIAVWSET